jgi:hypothetical protein
MHSKRRALFRKLRTPALLHGGWPSGKRSINFVSNLCDGVCGVGGMCCCLCVIFVCLCVSVCPTGHPRVLLLYRLMGLREGENDEDHGVEAVSFIMHLVSLSIFSCIYVCDKAQEKSTDIS